MADQNTSLPVRSEADADQLVIVRISDATTANQNADVDADGNLHVEAHGNDPAGTDRVIRTSELGATSVDGEYDVADNTDPSNMGVMAMVRNAAPVDSQQTQRITAVTNGAADIRAMDVALHDEDGEPYSASNPMPIQQVGGTEGTEVHDFDEGSAIASAATSIHDFSVADGDVFQLHKILSSASGKMKVELQIGDGAAAETFATKVIEFNSTANPSAPIELKIPIQVTGTVDTTTVRVIRTNLDVDAQDLHSTIIGVTE